jgi:hypothetical protein
MYWSTSVVPVSGQPLCHPKRSITVGVRFSEMIPLTLERKWPAIISVDASRCQADATGYFDVVITRLSETAPEVDVSERFAWRPPSVEATVKLAADEAVDLYRVENVTPCFCPK